MSEYPQNRKKEALFDIDISDWDGVSPYQLMNDPYLLSQKPIFEAAPRALKYARAGGSDHYDEIGFRSSGATPTKGAVPLQTVGRMRLEQESEDRKQISPESEALIEVHEKLRHSPLDLPDGHYKYQITDNRIDVAFL